MLGKCGLTYIELQTLVGCFLIATRFTVQRFIPEGFKCDRDLTCNEKQIFKKKNISLATKPFKRDSSNR